MGFIRLIVLNTIAAIFLLLLIIIGAIYVNCVEESPVWERAHILAIGFGIYFGIIGLMCNVI